MLLFHPVRQLEYDIQKQIARQSEWGLGHNSRTHICLFSRHFIPPSDVHSIELHMSFDLSAYNPLINLIYRNSDDGSTSKIADIELALDDKAIVNSLESVIAGIVEKYDDGQDRCFKEKLQHKMILAYFIERNTYHKIKDKLPLPLLSNLDTA